VLVDREQGAREALAEAGYVLHAAVTLSELLAIYRRTGVVDNEAYGRIVAYLGAH